MKAFGTVDDCHGWNYHEDCLKRDCLRWDAVIDKLERDCLTAKAGLGVWQTLVGSRGGETKHGRILLVTLIHIDPYWIYALRTPPIHIYALDTVYTLYLQYIYIYIHYTFHLM